MYRLVKIVRHQSSLLARSVKLRSSRNSWIAPGSSVPLTNSPYSAALLGREHAGSPSCQPGALLTSRRAFRLKIDDEIHMGRRSQVAGSVRSSRFGKNVLGPSQLAVGQRDPRSVILGAAYESD